ncbi:MAG TPA: substrate-binding domain-containing protein [Actinomycetota bacterium]
MIRRDRTVPAHRFVPLRAFFAAGVVALSAVGTGAVVGSAPCRAGDPIVGKGSTSQTEVQVSLLIPAYEDRCPNRQGTIGFQAVGNAEGASAAIEKDDGHYSAPSTIYAVDQPLTTAEKQIADADLMNPFRPALSSTIMHVPIYADGVAIAYNTGSCGSGTLNVSASTLSLIYLGQVTAWNDPTLVADNPGLEGCSLKIKPAVRIDESGSTVAIKEYLSKANPAWLPYAVRETTDVWPSTLSPCRGIGEGGMASCASDVGGIAYVQFKVARARGLPMAKVQNASGSFVAPAPASKGYASRCTAAMSAATTPASTSVDWGSFSLAYGAAGYPVCRLAYVLVYQHLGTAYHRALSHGQAASTYWFLATAVSDDVQDSVRGLGYVPLAANVRALSQNGVDTIRE